MKQKTLRVFEVGDFEKLKNIISSKLPLIKNHFFMLKEKNEEIEKLLKENNLNYFILNGESFTSKKEITPEIKIIEKEKIIIDKSKTKIFDKIIRSGEEIVSDDNLIFLNRINAGAKIECEGSVEIFDENEGVVICKGEYIIVKKNIKGTIIFNGENIGVVDKLTIFYGNEKKVLE
ncbi:septum formation inhibitor [Caminibacter sp.]